MVVLQLGVLLRLLLCAVQQVAVVQVQILVFRSSIVQATIQSGLFQALPLGTGLLQVITTHAVRF